MRIDSAREAFVFQKAIADFLQSLHPSDPIAATRADQLVEFLDGLDDDDTRRLAEQTKALHDSA